MADVEEKSKPTTSPKKQSVSKKKKAKNGPKVPPWTFPKNTLEDAIRVPQAIEQQNGGNPMKSDLLVKAVGFNSTSDWRFLDLLRSANLYGLVEGSGRFATVAMTDIGNGVVAPGSPTERQSALLKAFRNVEDFRKVEDFYKGKKLPEDEFFENTLVREFSIPRERVQPFIQIFTKNLEFLKAFRAADGSAPIVEDLAKKDSGSLIQSKPGSAEIAPKGGRTYLDTCFVMMPFGTWQDIYYKEIFTPAIKDAGMEPLRADELFSTGTVIEQIWEQIQKSKILLADLTGKNANVFYELGLSHAAQKPVVFTSANIEDVPFDLRHLRVIVYDLNDPFWGQKLKENLAAYLRNAKNDPNKSIPQPFRS
jgi:hypothetical protein